MRALTTDEVTGHGQHACTWHEFGERIALAKASRARVGVHHALTFLSPRVYEYSNTFRISRTHTHQSQKESRAVRVSCGRRERRLAPTWSCSYMPPVDYLSPEGLRVDGRRPNEARLLRCRMGAQAASVDGSCYFEQGNTKVLVSVCGPKEASKRKTDSARACFIAISLHCRFLLASIDHSPTAIGLPRKWLLNCAKSLSLSFSCTSILVHRLR